VTWEWALAHLACPACGGALRVIDTSPDRADAVLGHDLGTCPERYPVIGGIPRLLTGPARLLLRVAHAGWFATPLGAVVGWPGDPPVGSPDLELVERFDAEWRSFSRVASKELDLTFERYFDVVPPESYREGALVVDAGCGAGRWAEQVQRRGARVIAVDLGRSVEVAHDNTRASGRVVCVQGDVRSPPLRPASFDLVYSLGVLHHISETEDALGSLARLVRPGGLFLLYLYYALETRPPAYRAIFRGTDAARRLTSLLPQQILAIVATAIAAVAYWPLARLARVLAAVGATGLAAQLPLSFYARSSFRTMRNDSLDRFGTRLEKRYTRAEVTRLLEAAGLTNVIVSSQAPFWHAVARRPEPT